MSPIKVLFAGTLDPGSTARHRMEALGRLGYDVIPFNFADYMRGAGRGANWIYHRVLAGPAVSRINHDLRRVAESAKPKFILIDKGIFVWAKTISYFSSSIAPTIQYNLDNPFGDMGEPWWRHVIESVPCYDVHFVPREVNLLDYKAVGAKHVIRVPLAYEPTIHYPPPPDWGETERCIDVSFTGSPYDDRPQFLTRLLAEHGIAIDVRGDRWKRVLRPDIARKIHTGASVYDGAYRQRFWDSKICLAFVTRSNRDQVAHKSFEIAGAGGFLLAEATDEHLAAFEDGKEAVFFTDLADCARLIRKYLPDRALREKIAMAGYHRAVDSGYSNDARLRQAFAAVRKLFPD